jgi:hypothetical protein
VSDTPLGPFCVRTERAQIAAYKSAVSGNGDDIPAAFPIRWLAEPEIRGAIEKACERLVPLHVGQSFEYLQPLHAEAEYRLSVILEQHADPPRLSVKGEVVTSTGHMCLRMETLLRLVGSAGELAA